MPPVTCVLHHHIGAEGPFEQGLGIASTPQAYAAQIEWMAARYDIISLDQLLSGDLPRRPLLLTFDDAFRSVVDVVRDVLAPRGLPCVYFVNPGLLEPEAISLDSTLAWAANTVGLERLCAALDLPVRDSVGQLVVQDMAAHGATRRAEIRDKVLADFGPPDLAARAPLMVPEDLAELVSLGAEIGNHTLSHVHCRSLSSSEIETEIVASKARLETLCGHPVRAFSVPYGHEAELTETVLEALRASGHAAIFLVHARSNRWQAAPDVWYRTSLHDEAPATLPRKLAHLPFLRSLKHQAGKLSSWRS